MIISNPVLIESSNTLLMDKPHLKEDDEEDAGSSTIARSSSTQRVNRSLLPSLSLSKKRLKSFIQHPRRKQPNEPIIHYNGPCETLDQLPEDKYEWIVSESVEVGRSNPLANYPRSIVLRKPHYVNAVNYLSHRQKPKAKGSFYIRVLELSNSYTSKPCYIKPKITMDDEAFYGSYIQSQKCGKVGTKATLDETYIIDLYKESQITLSITSRTKSLLGSISSHFKKPEICLGSFDFHVGLNPKEKKIERIMLKNNETDDGQYQVLVVYGTFISPNVMTLLDDSQLYEGYITVYTKGKIIPRWTRYWARLTPSCFMLYDFEYKERRKPVCEISLSSIQSVFHPPVDDDERLVDVGSLGLALQFNEHVLDESEVVSDVLEYRMYILPDNAKSSKEWEDAFTAIAGLIKEYRYDDCFNATRFDRHDKAMFIPTKFLW